MMNRETPIRGWEPVPHGNISETDREAEGIRGASLLAECGAGKNDGRSGTHIPPPGRADGSFQLRAWSYFVDI